MKHMKEKSPVLLAILCREDPIGNYFKAWCPFCQAWHMHSPEEGHRIAHCDDENKSPFRQTGYILRDARKDSVLRNKLK